MAKNPTRLAAPAPARSPLKPRRILYPDARSTTLRRYRSTGRLWSALLKTTALGVALAAASPAAAQNGTIKEVGVGIVAGDPIGGTAKLWLNRDLAFDVGAGFSGGAVFWGDALYHMWDLLPQPREGKLGVYLGAGPRLEARSDAEFGLRTIGGVTWRLAKQPLEFFAEAGPVFRLTQGGGVEADGGVGVRFYFSSAR